MGRIFPVGWAAEALHSRFEHFVTAFFVVYDCCIEILLAFELYNRAQNDTRRRKIMYECEGCSRFLSWWRFVPAPKYVRNILDIIRQYDATILSTPFLINRSTYLLFSVTFSCAVDETLLRNIKHVVCALVY